MVINQQGMYGIVGGLRTAHERKQPIALTHAVKLPRPGILPVGFDL